MQANGERMAVSSMSLYSYYVKERAVHLFNEGKKASSFAEVLEAFAVLQIGMVARWKVSGRLSKVLETMDEVIEDQMRRDDETTAAELQKMLASHGEDISVCTVLHLWVALGWTYRGSSYCQLIRQTNKIKRLEFASANLGYNFEDAILTDECVCAARDTPQILLSKAGETPRPKPRYTLK